VNAAFVSKVLVPPVRFVVRRANRGSARWLSYAVVRLIALARIGTGRQDAAARLFGQMVTAFGSEAFLDAYVDALIASPRSQDRSVAHGLLLMRGQLGRAEDLERTPGPLPWGSADYMRPLRSDRLFTAGDPIGSGLALLSEPKDDAEPLLGSTPIAAPLVPRAVRAASASGAVERVLELAGPNSMLSEADRRVAAFDALWAEGDGELAVAELDTTPVEALADPRIYSRLRLTASFAGRTESEVFEGLTAAVDQGELGVDWMAQAMFEFDRIDELLALTTTPGWGAVGPTGTYWAACAHYVTHDYEAAREELARLYSTGKQWDADKLEARILFEEGRFADAVANREPKSRLRTSFDEVLYYANLRVGDRANTFATYLHWRDRQRLRHEFGAAVWDGDRERLGADPKATAFVIAQDGPGDEIALAATYGELTDLAGAVSATCDPRLRTLLQRSFPGIEFLGTQRQSSRPILGFSANGSHPRQLGSMFDLLDSHVYERAVSFNSVVMGRSLVRLTQDSAPYSTYLMADPGLVHIARSGPAAGSIGLTWRSEFTGGMRRVHYLNAADLKPLAELDVGFVNLQYDATPSELAVLRATFGNRLVQPEGIDLRNDLDATAAFLTCLGAVVGVGTTTVELAGAVGTPTVYLNPNQWGQWRRTAGDRDYWHASTTLACAPSPQRRTECVAVARDRLRAMGFGAVDPDGR
jgi:hypothetical protein